MCGELQKVPDCSFSTFSPNPLKPGSKDAEGGYRSAGTPVASESFAKEKGPQRDGRLVRSPQQAITWSAFSLGGSSVTDDANSWEKPPETVLKGA